jgi:hypothetical protein
MCATSARSRCAAKNALDFPNGIAIQPGTTCAPLDGCVSIVHGGEP